MWEEILKESIQQAIPIAAPIFATLIITLVSFVLIQVRKMIGADADLAEHTRQMEIVTGLVESIVAELEITLVKRLKNSKGAIDEDGKMTTETAQLVKKAALTTVKNSLPKQTAKALKKSTTNLDMLLSGMIERAVNANK